jgi:fructose-1-phosphate kinase PfkB-like protein
MLIVGPDPNAARTARWLGHRAQIITVIPSADAPAWDAFSRGVRDRLGPGEVLLCSGSLPPGAPRSGYAQLARAARHTGSETVIDAAGSVLEATLEAGEGVVTPNLAEAEALLHGARSEPVHGSADARDRALDAANRLIRRGAWRAVVTAGGGGAAYAQQGPRVPGGWVAARPVEVRNPLGAGDAFAAALALCLGQGTSLEAAVVFGVEVAGDHVAGRGADDRVRRVRFGGSDSARRSRRNHDAPPAPPDEVPEPA